MVEMKFLLNSTSYSFQKYVHLILVGGTVHFRAHTQMHAQHAKVTVKCIVRRQSASHTNDTDIREK